MFSLDSRALTFASNRGLQALDVTLQASDVSFQAPYVALQGDDVALRCDFFVALGDGSHNGREPDWQECPRR